MAPTAVKRRNIEDEVRRPKKKIRKFKKQKEYHSSSEDDDEEDLEVPYSSAPKAQEHNKIAAKSNTTGSKQQIVTPSVPAEIEESSEDDASDIDGLAPVQDIDAEELDEDLDEVHINTALNMASHEDSESASQDGSQLEEDDDVEVNGLDELDDDDDDDEEEDLVDEFDSDDAATTTGARKKRNDPTAFATSISKILTTKLSTQKRNDPILSRSKDAEEANKALADGKLETKARASIRVEKQQLLEKGRVRDTLGLNTPGIDTGAIIEEENRLKKTAQRGVVKLFNAVRAAQVRAEEAEQVVRQEGLVGMHKREERINEMSKEGFLDLISRGGKQAVGS